MKDKNKKLIIVVASLLLVIGVSFAYFTVSVLLDGDGASTSGTTATLGSSELKVEGSLSFSDIDVYPGHKNVSSIKVVATGDNELIPYHVIWEGENTLNTTLKYTVYKLEQSINVKATCEKKNQVIEGSKTYYEECNISNESKLGSIISSGEIKKGETKKNIISDEFITSSKEGEEIYYYVILEYPNNDENQNSDIGGRFSGEVKVEINDIKADISIIATYIEENGEYKEVEEIPSEGYQLNTEKSSCNNNAILGWDKENSRIYVERLNKSGTECTLYYDEYVSAKEAILANSKVNDGTPNFSQAATTDEGIYKTEDDWGESYYFRGAVTNNWLKFAGYYWRIIRINGDGSIRAIYNGTSTTATEKNTMINNGDNQDFGSDYDQFEYVGYMYTEGEQHGNTTNSSIKTVIDNWYNSNLKSYADKISKEAGFCGDREMASGYEWSSKPSSDTYCLGHERLAQNSNSVNPTLKCSNSLDLYTVSGSSKGNKALTNPVGLIIADEVAMAGAKYGNGNTSYYLYVDEPYWTMSPYGFFPLNTFPTNMFYIDWSGGIGIVNSAYSFGVRPVINIVGDVTLTGTGTNSDPYVVIGAE